MENALPISTMTNPNGLENINSIDRLPSELFAIIFDFARILEVRDGSDRYKPFPLVVSQVSARWRALTLDMPTLWKDISITENMMTATELVQAYLERSRDCLLNIDLDLINRMNADAWAERIEEQLDMIVDHVGRWQHLAVRGTWRGSFLTFVSRLRDSCAPFLESIGIIWSVPYSYVDGSTDTCSTIFTGGAPRLSTFLIDNVNSGFDNVNSSLILPPLSSLTSFTLGYNPLSASSRIFRYALTQMPHLRKLFVCIDNVDPDNCTTLELPSLISLEIMASEDGAPKNVLNLLAMLNTPGIEFLLLRGFTDKDMQPLLEFFQSNSVSDKYPSLRTLELRDPYLSSHQVTRLFRSIPTIVNFSITDPAWSIVCGYNVHTLKPLSDTGHDVLFPDLRIITLAKVDAADFAMLRKIVWNRISLGRPISCLKIPITTLNAWDGTKYNLDLDWLRDHVHVMNFEEWLAPSCSASLQAFSYRFKSSMCFVYDPRSFHSFVFHL
jgi:hypothetical protein